MSNKMHMLTACIIALIVVLLTMHHPPQSSTHSATSGQVGAGIASINIDHREDLLLFGLTFRDPQGESIPPRMNVEPTFAVVNSAGREVQHGTFEFG